MKMKALCEKTGLTRKTVLFYEEQGLIMPEKTRINGRDYREYSDEDVKKLLAIATLRKCRFSVEEIKRINVNPEDARVVFRELKDRLRRQRSELEELLEKVEMISEQNIYDVSTLVRELRETAKPFALPESDLEPHFLHLDKLEADLSGEQRPSKYHTDIQSVSIDQDHIIMDSRFGRKKLLDDIKEDLQEEPRYGVPEPAGGPIWLGLLKGIAILGLVMFFFDMIQASRGGILSKWFLMDIGIMVGLIAIIIGITAIQRRLGRSE